MRFNFNRHAIHRIHRLVVASAALGVPSLALIQAVVLPTSARAQDATPTPNSTDLTNVVNEYEGVADDVDKKHRGPVVSVRTEVTPASGDAKGSARLLVDAYVPNEDYTKYPLKFDFYVNRRLVSSQIRSTELPGAIGLDVTPEIATVPFNYAIIATVLHPNREFVTVFTGAAFTSVLTETFSCSLVTAVSAEGAQTTYDAANVATTQPGENTLALNFVSENGVAATTATPTATAGDTGEQATVSVTATLGSSSDSGREASGTLTYVVDGNSREVPVTGSVSLSGQAIQSLDLTNSDDTVSLNCTK